MNLLRWLSRGRYPNVDRRLAERRVAGCSDLLRSEEDLEVDQREQQEVRNRLRRIQHEIDIIRRAT